MKKPEYHFAAVYHSRLIANESLVMVAAPVKIEIITGPGYAYPLSSPKNVLPLTGVVGEEAEIPSPAPLDFEAGKRYIIISTRTNENPSLSEESCHRLVDRVTAILSLLAKPTLFALPVYVGWLSPSPQTPIRTQMMFSNPIELQRTVIEKAMSQARATLGNDSAMRDRFDLMARLFLRTMGASPNDEAFLWAWTCLEIFPMRGTQKYAHVAPYLAHMLGANEAELARRLDIRGLHRLRSKLVHSGQLGLSAPELYAKLSLLRGIVYTVMRGMCGLPYDGEFERLWASGV